MSEQARAPSQRIAQLARLSLIPTALLAALILIIPWRGHAYLAAALILTACASHAGAALQIARRIEREVSARFGARVRRAHLLHRWDEASQTGVMGRLVSSVGGVTAAGLLGGAASVTAGATVSCLLAMAEKAMTELPVGLGVLLVALVLSVIPLAATVAMHRAASDMAVWAAEQRDLAALDGEVVRLATEVRAVQGGALSLDRSSGTTGGLTEVDEATQGGALEATATGAEGERGEVVLSFSHEQDHEEVLQHAEVPTNQHTER